MLNMRNSQKIQDGESVPLSCRLHVFLHHNGHCSGSTQNDLQANLPPGELRADHGQQTIFLSQIGFGWALLLCLAIFLTALLFCLPLYFKTRLHNLTNILVSSQSVARNE